MTGVWAYAEWDRLSRRNGAPPVQIRHAAMSDLTFPQHKRIFLPCPEKPCHLDWIP